MDNLIFCLNATVPILRSSCLAAGCAAKLFTKQTLTDIDRLSFKVLLPILLFAISHRTHHRAVRPVFFFFCAGATTVYFCRLDRRIPLS